MNNLTTEKNKLRKKIASLKKEISSEEFLLKSAEVMDVVEITGVFQDAKNIFIYHSMPDEVNTIEFIKKWWNEKQFYLPVTNQTEINFKKYTAETQLQRSAYGIYEPIGENFTDYRNVDLIIVPGVAFDRMQNRMGYGKGYYDRFLPKIKAPKLGICFDFQLLDKLPVGNDYIKMDYVVSENDLIW